MPRPRAYRDDIRCRHCGSNWIVKNGKDHEKQTFLCRHCDRRFTQNGKNPTHPDAVKKQAYAMYANGVGVSAISRILDVKLGTVYTWIKKKGKWALRALASKRKTRKSKGKAKAISLDEMWTYKGVRKGPRRKSCWIWTAVIEWEDGSWSFEFAIGDRSEKTLLKLLKRLPFAEEYHTDKYAVYGSWIPSSQHVVGKGGKVNRNEGIHSLLRDCLYRLRRATKGYTKCLWMLEASIAFVALKRGWYEYHRL